jgi:hypothetical protein
MPQAELRVRAIGDEADETRQTQLLPIVHVAGENE